VELVHLILGVFDNLMSFYSMALIALLLLGIAIGVMIFLFIMRQSKSEHEESAKEANVVEFYRVLSGLIVDIFLETCNRDKEAAREAMELYAQNFVPEDEYGVLKKMDFLRLSIIVAKMSVSSNEATELLGKHLNITKKAYSEYEQLNEET
jgi:hypothetical protein